MIERLLAKALGGGHPTDHHRQITGLIADVWLANLAAFISQRATGRPSP